MKKDKTVLTVCAVAFSVNIVLFFVKLYIGLRTNSISIYSDAVNNLFDSLSGLLTLISLGLIMRKADLSMKGVVSKSEQFFSLIMAIIVSFTGFYFAYSSLERFMYPTPVWYTYFYLGVLILTALVKIGLFFFYKGFSKKTTSPVVRVMAFDSILDFFITAVTVLTLYISGSGSFALDAVFGVVISAVIIVSAIKLIISNAKALVNFVGSDDREAINEILTEHGVCAEEIEYSVSSDTVSAYVKAKITGENEIALIKEECIEKTGIVLNITI